MKRIASTLLGICLLTGSYAQTLFTYGKNAVSKTEFIAAFNKNPNTTEGRKKALQEYLKLYVNFKLKVQAAYDAGLDKDQTQQTELENFKRQIADNILNQEANIKALVTEAFNRSQKDIDLGEIVIEVAENADTLQAYNRIHQAYQDLQKGKSFAEVSAEYSTDAATKAAGGNLGYITAFTLDYPFENIAYSLKPNATSTPFRSKLGYHIFKNLGERKALGTRKVEQILIAFPPGATDTEKASARRKADSVYNLLQKGSSFEELARQVSNDISSSNNNGLLPEFGISTYAPTFEQAAFALKNKGDISQPFSTASGFHLLKLVEAKFPGTDINNAETYSSLQEKVLKDDRLAASKKLLLARQLKIIKYKPASVSEKDMLAFTDSSLKPSPASFKAISNNTVLFSFDKKTFTAGDWLRYVKGVRGLPAYVGKPMKDIYKDFIDASAGEYYKDHLEDYNADFKKQVKEFKDANMLFATMEKNVWGKANIDSVGLRNYYRDHSAKYVWGPSVDALIVSSTNEAAANDIQKSLHENATDWRQVAERYASSATIDSGRYELGQLPVVERTNFTHGLITAPVKNKTDGTVTFNYIFKVYEQPAPRSFEDARGMVISDYQQVLEDNWVTELRKKYPVKVNTAVFNSIK